MRTRRDYLLGALAAAAAAPSAAPTVARAQESPTGKTSREIHRQPLQAEIGRDAVFVELTIEPGTPSNAHRHGGMVLGYVIEGRLKFAIGDEPARVVEEGEAFFEPSGVLHRLGESADGNRVRLLAVVLLEPGKELVMPA